MKEHTEAIHKIQAKRNTSSSGKLDKDRKKETDLEKKKLASRG